MVEAILLLVIIVLVGLIGFLDYNNRKERKSLVNAVLAKDTQELINLELADKTKIEAKPTEVQDSIVDFSSLSDDEATELITRDSNE